MNKFDWSKYDYDYEDLKLQPTVLKEVPRPKSNFDWDKYDTSEPETKKQTHHEKIEGTGFALLGRTYEKQARAKEKAGEQVALGAISGATLGGSKQIKSLNPPEGIGTTASEFLGAAIPFGGAFNLFMKPFQMLDKALKFGKIGKAASHIGAGAATGASTSVVRQGLKFEGLEGIEPGEVALETAVGALIPAAIEGVRGGKQWFSSLKPKQQAQALTEGVIPNNLTPDQYKFYQDEVVPALFERAQQEHQSAVQKAVQDLESSYQQEVNAVKSKYEAKLLKAQEERQLSAEEFQKAKSDYQNELRNVQAKHENTMIEIQTENEASLKEFEQAQSDFEKMKMRNEAVKAAIKHHIYKPSETTRQVSVEPLGGEYLPETIRPTGRIPETHLENRIGSVIDPNPSPEIILLDNRSRQGEALTNTIRANDQVDYGEVRNAYRTSDELNKTISIEQPNLVTELRVKLKQLNEIPELSPPQKQEKSIIEKVLSEVQILDEAGNFIGYKPISNHVLAEQAKAVRYFMDFSFEHGNSRGVLTPLTNMLESAIEMGGIFSQNEAAVTAHRNAKALYRQWAQTYDNPYIRPFRDVENFNYIKNMENTLHIDNFNQVNNVLQRSNCGQQMSNKVRSEIVKSNLKKFIDNPKLAVGKEFENALREMRDILTPEEIQGIRQQFIQARRTPVVTGKKIKKIEKPKEPKLKEIKETKIPIFEKKPRKVAEPELPEYPEKPELKPTPEMIIAGKKMKITPEEAMKKTNTVSGLKELKEEFSNTEADKKIFDKIAKYKIRDILYEGNIEREFTGEELYRIMNKGENYSIFSELLGEEAAADLLVSAKEIGKIAATVKNLKKLGMKVTTAKAAILLGIL